jgi:cell division protein FtsI (penicillin-binding protein 3)
MGQEVSVTPIQIVSAISAVANGGTYNHPTIVRDIQSNRPAPDIGVADPHRATDEQTAATVREMMEGVMTEGTGKLSQLNGYTSGGKSGTAQKIDPATGRYSANEYNSSFAGFAPVNNPAVAIIVVLDSPVGEHHGGMVGGPIFKRVAQQVLTYLGVPHDIPAPSDFLQMAKNTGRRPQPSMQRPRNTDDSERARFAAAVERSAPSYQPLKTAAFGSTASVVVPSLTGQSVRSVIEACSKAGLEPGLIGEGVAVEQFPPAGSTVDAGSRVTVRFGRAAQLVPTSAHGAGN